MTISDDKKIEKYLSDIECFLGNMNQEQKYKSMIQIKQFLINYGEENNKSVDDTIASFRDKKEFIRSFLDKHGMSDIKIKRKNNNFLKLVIILMLCFFITVAVFIYIALKSISPVWNIDESTGDIYLFGKSFKIPHDSITVTSQSNSSFNTRSNGKQSSIANRNISVNNSESADGISLVDIYGRNGSIAIRSSDDNKVKYSCELELSINQSDDILKVSRGSMRLDLKDKASCLVFIPKYKKVRISFDHLNLNMKNIYQSINVEFMNGSVQWTESSYDKFYIKTNIDNVNFFGLKEMPQLNGTLKVDITVKGKGSLKISKD